MKHIKLLLIGLIAAIPLAIGITTANAQTFRSGNAVSISSDQTINSTLYTSGRNIDVAGNVNGDVICAGQNINISGTITGDVLCAGQNIQITGTVEGSVRLAGQNVTITGRIQRNVSAASQDFTVSARSTINGDISTVGQDAAINGTVGRDIAAANTNLTINSRVGRNVTSTGNQLTLGNSANIRGNVEYTSPKQLDRENGAQVAGRTIHHQTEQTSDSKPVFGLAFSWLFALYLFVSMLLIALVLVLLMPQIFQRATDRTLANPLMTVLIGFAASILVPILLIGLMFTVIGIPLAIFGWFVWVVLLFLAGPFAAYLLGRILLRGGAKNAILVMLAGAAVLLILYFIPFINILAILLALWFGLGTVFQTLPRNKPKYALPRTTTPSPRT